jgi:rhodanese-related sulfurtransferase
LQNNKITQLKEVMPSEAFLTLKSQKNSVLIDVRTPSEWKNIGIVDEKSLANPIIFVSWQIPPFMEFNNNFIKEVESCLENIFNKNFDKNDLTLFFICRIGARSYQASQYFIDNGYFNINNIIGGFEGEANNAGARSLISGWQYEKLPWEKLPWEKLPWEKLP